MLWCVFLFALKAITSTRLSLILCSAGTLQQLISDTMVRWAQESVIEDPELVRAMFVLLHRQYDGIGGQVCSFHHTRPVRYVTYTRQRPNDIVLVDQILSGNV